MKALTQGLALAGLILAATGLQAQESQNCSIVQWELSGEVRAVASTSEWILCGEGMRFHIVDLLGETHPQRSVSLDMPAIVEDILVEGTLAYVACGDAGLRIVDLDDPDNPAIIGSLDTPGFARELALHGSLLGVASGGSGLQLMDVQDPESPAVLGSYNTSGYSNSVVFRDSTALLADQGGGLRSIDLRNVSQPVELDSLGGHGDMADLFLVDDTAWVSVSSGIIRVDVSQPDSLVDNGFFDLDGTPGEIEGNDSLAVVICSDVLRLVDISDPENPQYMGQQELGGNGSGLVLQDSLALVATLAGGLDAIAVSQTWEPYRVALLDTPEEFHDAAFGGGQFVVAGGEAGLLVYDVQEAEGVRQVSQYRPDCDARRVLLDGTTAYLSCYDDGIRIVDLSDPVEPVELGHLPLSGLISGMVMASPDRMLALGYPFSVYDIDLSDPAMPVLQDSLVSPEVKRGIAVDGQTAYLAILTGVRILSLEDPESLEDLGSVTMDATVQDVAADNGMLATIGDRLVLHDLSNPQVPVEVSDFEETQGSQLVLTQDLAYAMDPETGLDILDLQNLQMPLLGGWMNISNLRRVAAVDSLACLVFDDRMAFLTIDPAVELGEGPRSLPASLSLDAVVPNPFNPVARVEFSLQQPGAVRLAVYNLRGRLVRTLHEGPLAAGSHSLNFDGGGLAGGVYLLRLSANGESAARKVVYLP